MEGADMLVVNRPSLFSAEFKIAKALREGNYNELLLNADFKPLK